MDSLVALEGRWSLVLQPEILTLPGWEMVPGAEVGAATVEHGRLCGPDHDAAAAAAYGVGARRWRELFDELMVTVGVRFRRPEPRWRALDFVRGLLAPLPRRNCWTIAEHAGDASPDGMQDLLARAQWDDGQVRADVRGVIAGQLGDPDAVLIVDERGI